MESIWKEIRNTYHNENEKCIHIDAWETDDDNEEGTAIAKIYVDSEPFTEYLDSRAETDPYAQKIINRILDALEADEEQEPEPETLRIAVDFHLLMREGETIDEALQRFTETVLDDIPNLADHHIDWNLTEYEGE